ncbi:unnamed protein product [Lampetra planeri]
MWTHLASSETLGHWVTIGPLSGAPSRTCTRAGRLLAGDGPSWRRWGGAGGPEDSGGLDRPARRRRRRWCRSQQQHEARLRFPPPFEWAGRRAALRGDVTRNTQFAVRAVRGDVTRGFEWRQGARFGASVALMEAAGARSQPQPPTDSRTTPTESPRARCR